MSSGAEYVVGGFDDCRASFVPRGTGRMACALALLGPTHADALDLPSGQSVELHEVIVEGTGEQSIARFRFIAPSIARDGGTVRFTDAELDMARLCEVVALPYITEHAVPTRTAIISLSDRVVEFGAADPDATQFFDAFDVRDNICIWEGL